MEDLKKYREIIDRVDTRMAALFEERMHAVKEIARYKKEKGLPVFDAGREKAMLLKETENIEDPELKEWYREFLQSMMDISKQYQRKIRERMDKEPE